jgi:hypothetical protein
MSGRSWCAGRRGPGAGALTGRGSSWRVPRGCRMPGLRRHWEWRSGRCPSDLLDVNEWQWKSMLVVSAAHRSASVICGRCWAEKLLYLSAVPLSRSPELNLGILQAAHVPSANGGSDCMPTADSNYDAHESTGLRRYSWANSAGVGGATEKFPCRLRILRYDMKLFFHR